MVAAVLLGTTACGATANARALARETLAQSTEYEDSVRAISRALTKYYEGLVPDLEQRLDVQRGIELSSRINSLADDAVVATLLRGFQPHDFRAFVDQAITAEADAATPALTALVQMRQRQKVLLDQLEAQEKRLKIMRGKLEALQAEPGWKDVLTLLKPYLETAREAHEKTKKK